jgi:hypothetical protein
MDPRAFVRTLRLILIVAAVGLASFPLLVILDLSEGGTGYGLCPSGVASCRNPYTAAPELATVLTVGLLVVLGGFRVTTHLARELANRPVQPDTRSR